MSHGTEHLVQLSSLTVLSAHRVCVLWNSSSDKSVSKGLKLMLGFLKKWLVHTNFNWCLDHLIIGIHSWMRRVQHESILYMRIINFSTTSLWFLRNNEFTEYTPKYGKLRWFHSWFLIFAVICFWFHCMSGWTPQLNMNFSELHMHGIYVSLLGV